MLSHFFLYNNLLISVLLIWITKIEMKIIRKIKIFSFLTKLLRAAASTSMSSSDLVFFAVVEAPLASV